MDSKKPYPMIVELTTGVTDLIAVKLPDGGTNPRISDLKGEDHLLCECSFGINVTKLPPGKWLPIGFLKDITEEQAREIVPLYAYELYKDYATQPEVTDNGVKVYGFPEALKSLHSLLQSKQVYTVNPYGEKPEMPTSSLFEPIGSDEEDHRRMMEWGKKMVQYNAAEQRVGNWFLLRKEAEK